MQYAARLPFAMALALSLGACQYESPIGAADASPDAPPTSDVPVTPDAPPGDAPACSPVRGTFDCGTEQIAVTICNSNRAAGRPCHVCVQRVDPADRPVSWSAIETPAECGCPAVQRVPATDGGPGDGGPADVPVGDVPADGGPFGDVPADGGPGDAPDPAVCENPRATSDCATEAIATTICDGVRSGGRACHVCVQNTDPSGRPTRWSAVESPAECGCPPPRIDRPADGGAGFSCGTTSCTAGRDVCVSPPGPGTCPPPDAGVCPAGCPGCPPITDASTCQAASVCAAGDCACLATRYCMGRVGVCTGDAATGVRVTCMGS